MFKGLKKTKEKTDTYQRINKMGLTGCVTFYNVLMSKIKIYAENGQCEDTVNIINGNGAIEDIEIFNASSDGLDLDFSNLFMIYHRIFQKMFLFVYWILAG